jgi:hypothetical protein
MTITAQAKVLARKNQLPAGMNPLARLIVTIDAGFQPSGINPRGMDRRSAVRETPLPLGDSSALARKLTFLPEEGVDGGVVTL